MIGVLKTEGSAVLVVLVQHLKTFVAVTSSHHPRQETSFDDGQCLQSMHILVLVFHDAYSRHIYFFPPFFILMLPIVNMIETKSDAVPKYGDVSNLDLIKATKLESPQGNDLLIQYNFKLISYLCLLVIILSRIFKGRNFEGGCF